MESIKDNDIISEEYAMAPGCTILGLIIGFVLCALMNLLLSCSTKNVESHDHTSVSTEVSTSSNVSQSESHSMDIDYSRFSQMLMSSTNLWNAHILRTIYSTDSVGNTHVASEERIDIDSKTKSHSNSNVEENANIRIRDTLVIIQRDTMYIATETDIENDYTKEVNKARWYIDLKYIIAFVSSIFLILIFLKLKSKFLHKN